MASARKPIDKIQLTRDNTLIIRGMFDPTNVDIYAAALLTKRALTPSEQPVYVVLASGGGNIDSSYILSDFIESFQNVVLVCQDCYSSAAGLFVVHKGPRLVTKESKILLHEAYDDHVTARIANSTKWLNALTSASDEFNKRIANAIKMPIPKYVSRITDKNWILEGSEMIKYHAADKLVQVECDDWIKLAQLRLCND